MVKRPVLRPAIFRPSLLILAEADCIFVTAFDKAVSTRDKTTMTPTDRYRFFSSTKLRTTTAPARIAMDFAIFSSDDAAVSKALALRIFEKLFSMPAIPSITLLTLPMPSEIALTKSYICLTTTRTTPIGIMASNFFQSKLPTEPFNFSIPFFNVSTSGPKSNFLKALMM